MNISKEQFGIEISRLLKEKNLTQRGLAEYLGLTSASVSFMLHNKLRPSQEHFDGIMEFIKADAVTIIKLKDLWRATQKNSEERNNINENLFALRCERGFSIQQVSADTGIPSDRLRILETRPDASPTNQEIELLKGFYGSGSLALRRNNNDKFFGKTIRENISYGGGKFAAGRVLPLIQVSAIARMPDETNLESYFESMSNKQKFCDMDCELAPRAAAVLICDSSELHYGIPGTLELIIGKNSPEHKDMLFIGRGSRGAVTLFRKQRNSLAYFGFAVPAPKITCVASLPVLEFKFITSCESASGKKGLML